LDIYGLVFHHSLFIILFLPFRAHHFQPFLHLLNIPPGDLVLLQGGIDAGNQFANVIHRDDAIDEQFLGGEHGFGQKHSLIPLGS
jgi:hypothetical protein